MSTVVHAKHQPRNGGRGISQLFSPENTCTYTPSQAVRFTGQANQSVLVHFTELQGAESARPVAVS
jgi:hypothetical protein